MGGSLRVETNVNLHGASPWHLTASVDASSHNHVWNPTALCRGLLGWFLHTTGPTGLESHGLVPWIVRLVSLSDIVEIGDSPFGVCRDDRAANARSYWQLEGCQCALVQNHHFAVPQKTPCFTWFSRRDFGAGGRFFLLNILKMVSCHWGTNRAGPATNRGAGVLVVDGRVTTICAPRASWARAFLHDEAAL